MCTISVTVLAFLILTPDSESGSKSTRGWVLGLIEEFRTICLKPTKHEIDPVTRFDIKPQLVVVEEGNYELDPAHYVSAPQLSWDAMLKQTGCRLELITDPEMNRMLANSMRRGICMISGR